MVLVSGEGMAGGSELNKQILQSPYVCLCQCHPTACLIQKAHRIEFVLSHRVRLQRRQGASDKFAQSIGTYELRVDCWHPPIFPFCVLVLLDTV